MKVRIETKTGYKYININRRKAIRERCLNCSAWTPKKVSNCEFADCPLHPFRSGKGKQNPKTRAKAIRNYCLWCMVEKKSEIKKCTASDCSLFVYRNLAPDKSAEIKSILKNKRIEPDSVIINKNEYQSMAN